LNESFEDGRPLRVDDIASLARHASMSSSYKPALLKAIVRIVKRDGLRSIPLTAIGAEFVELYWVQTVVFRLRQAASITKEPVVVREIRSTAERTGVRKLSQLPAATRSRLDRAMAGVLPINVLSAFHTSKPLTMKPLFAWEAGQEYVTLGESEFEFVRSNAHALETLANHWWARFLERVNLLAPLIIEKVERNGAERSSLAKYLKILSLTDEQVCFYCDQPLGDGGETHVDHVIPWSFLLSDPLWDLVLACARCNLAKSDRLPERSFLDKLTQRGIVRAKLKLPINFGSPFLDLSEIDRFYDAALSVEWPGGWKPTNF
jgi:hypothetical protein